MPLFSLRRILNVNENIIARRYNWANCFYYNNTRQEGSLHSTSIDASPFLEQTMWARMHRPYKLEHKQKPYFAVGLEMRLHSHGTFPCMPRLNIRAVISLVFLATIGIFKVCSAFSAAYNNTPPWLLVNDYFDDFDSICWHPNKSLVLLCLEAPAWEPLGVVKR